MSSTDSRFGEWLPDAFREFLDEHPRIAAGAALGPRAARAGRSSLSARRQRLRARAFFIVQCAISAGVSWFIAGAVVGHYQPFFAPVATLIALGQSFGQRIERVIEIVVGVAVGVLVGDLFVTAFGSGYWQLAAIIGISMAVATLLDAGVLMTTQAGVQAAFVTMIVAAPGTALQRWSDAAIGGLVALAAATITPTAPIRRPRQHTASVVSEVSAILHDTAAALRSGDTAAAEAALTRARNSEKLLATLTSVAGDGLAVVRSSPFRRGHLPAVQAIADLLVPLDRAIRNLRVLVRRAVVAIHTGENVPAAYVDVLDDLASATSAMATSLSIRELPEATRPALVAIAERTTDVAANPSLSSEVIRAQIRSIVVDLLMVTGLTYDEAIRYVPHTYSLDPGSEA